MSMPPVVAAQRLGSAFINSLSLCQPDKELQSATKAQIRRYISVQFEDYAVIGMMYDAAVQAGYQIIDFD